MSNTISYYNDPELPGKFCRPRGAGGGKCPISI
jgi:hypothetical protein